MANHVNARRLPRAQKLTIALAVLLVTYSLLGFFWLPGFINDKAVAAVHDQFGAHLYLEKVSFNPFTFELVAREGTFVSPNERQRFGFSLLAVNLSPWSAVLKRLTVQNLQLADPTASITSVDASDWQWLAEATAASQSPDPEVDPWNVVVENVQFLIGDASYSEPGHPVDFRTGLRGFEVTVSGLDTRPGQRGQLALELQPLEGGVITADARFGVSPPSIEGSLQAHELRPSSAWSYLAHFLDLPVSSGLLGLDGTFSAGVVDGELDASFDGSVTLAEFSMEYADGRSFANLGSLSISGISAVYTDRSVVVDEVAASDGRLVMRRLPDGELEIQSHLEPRLPVEVADAAGAPASAQEWTVAIPSVRLSAFDVEWVDESVTPTVDEVLTISELAVDDLRIPLQPIPVRLRVSHKQGKLSAEGPFSMEPPSWEGMIGIEDFALTPWSPYVSSVSGYALNDGVLTMTMDMRGTAAESVDYSLTGGLRVDTLDVANGQSGPSLLAAHSIVVDGIAGSPSGWVVQKLAVSGPAVTLERLDSGLNLPSAASSDEAEASEAEVDATSRVSLRIDAIEVIDGAVALTDRTLAPPYTTTLTDISVTLNDLDTQSDSPATAKVAALLDGYAAIDATAALIPWDPTRSSEFSVGVQGVEMPRFNPYIGSFIGRQLDRSQLALDLEYTLTGSALDAANHVTIAQLALGDTVPAEDAVSLPLGLAIALLQDSNGEIVLDVPISGDLADPKFRLGRVIGRAITGLLTKLVASPFLILKGLIPDGQNEDMDSVAFAPGSSELDPEAIQTLNNLAAALRKRPKLMLEVAPSAGVADRAAIAERQLQQWLDEQSEDSADAALEAVYRLRIGEPPVAAPPAAEDGDPEVAAEPDYAAMREALFNSIDIPLPELTDLASSRAQAIKAHFGELDADLADRVLLIAEELDVPVQADGIEVGFGITAR